MPLIPLCHSGNSLIPVAHPSTTTTTILFSLTTLFPKPHTDNPTCPSHSASQTQGASPASVILHEWWSLPYPSSLGKSLILQGPAQKPPPLFWPARQSATRSVCQPSPTKACVFIPATAPAWRDCNPSPYPAVVSWREPELPKGRSWLLP